jgi:hypothetical protein
VQFEHGVSAKVGKAQHQSMQINILHCWALKRLTVCGVFWPDLTQGGESFGTHGP